MVMQLWTDIRAQAAASPRKAGTLAALSLFLVGVVAYQFLPGGPAPAAADVVALPPAPAVDATGSLLVSGASPAIPAAGTGSLAGRPTSLLSVSERAAQLRPAPDLRRILLRDLFQADWARDMLAAADEAGRPKTNSPAADADNSVDVTELVLDATYLPEDGVLEPLAVVNGVLVRLQERVGTFVVEEIESRHVTLRQGDRRILLRMR
jgi:hypothetical protein